MPRLGELLVSAGVLTSAQLDRALRAQVMWGARLGTNLIELGFIDLDTLSTYLGRQHGLPAALARHFERVDRDLQRQLHADLAEQYTCLPLVRVGANRDVVIASTQPLTKKVSARIADELAVAPEQLIVAVAGELRIRYQLERVYNIARPARFMRSPGNTIPPFPQFEISDADTALEADDLLEIEDSKATTPQLGVYQGPGAATILAGTAAPAARRPPPIPGSRAADDDFSIDIDMDQSGLRANPMPQPELPVRAAAIAKPEAIIPGAPALPYDARKADTSIVPLDERPTTESKPLPRPGATPRPGTDAPLAAKPAIVDAPKPVEPPKPAVSETPKPVEPVTPAEPPKPVEPPKAVAKPAASTERKSEPKLAPLARADKPVANAASPSPIPTPIPKVAPTPIPKVAPTRPTPIPSVVKPGTGTGTTDSRSGTGTGARTDSRTGTDSRSGTGTGARTDSRTGTATGTDTGTDARKDSRSGTGTGTGTDSSPARAAAQAGPPGISLDADLAIPADGVPALRADEEESGAIAAPIHPRAAAMADLDGIAAEVEEALSIPTAVEFEESSGGRERRRYVRTLDNEPADRQSLGRIAIRRVALGVRDGDVLATKTLGEATRAIRRATNRDKVAELCIDTLFRFAPSCSAASLLVVRGQVATAWKGFVRDGSAPPEFSIQLDQPGLIPKAVHRTATVRAPSTDLSPIDQLLMVSLAQKSGDLVIVPVTIAKQVMCVIAIVTESEASIATCESVAAGAGAAFARLMRDASR